MFVSLASTDNIVDRLGVIQAEISKLSLQEKLIKDFLKKQGAGAHEGHLFRATVSVTERETVDWEAVAAKLQPSHQLVAAHTSRTEVRCVKVVARKAA